MKLKVTKRVFENGWIHKRFGKRVNLLTIGSFRKREKSLPIGGNRRGEHRDT